MASSKAKGSTTGTPSHTSTSTSTGGGNHHGGGAGVGNISGATRGESGSSTVTASSKHHNNSNVTGETHAKRLNKGKELVGKEIPTLDFNTLDISVLRRYKRIHKLKVKDYATKEDLVAAVSRHYALQPVKEADVIAAFVYTIMS
ncbi:8234_t:CDS:2 [Funneliformis geosporum]|uniref:13521_t:CDS:1 n=1 Tax=Funneliformis geosporum TaxID=1117311 RepID=A0A9W4SGU1_9GLOM|nr:8234_t:CDS:2 [Funneliformis geosporum]CAI2168014.1 13521_t:CDS:2 [Funneliformis geosporum]